jgi:hypothetical protein
VKLDRGNLPSSDDYCNRADDPPSARLLAALREQGLLLWDIIELQPAVEEAAEEIAEVSSLKNGFRQGQRLSALLPESFITVIADQSRRLVLPAGGSSLLPYLAQRADEVRKRIAADFPARPVREAACELMRRVLRNHDNGSCIDADPAASNQLTFDTIALLLAMVDDTAARETLGEIRALIEAGLGAALVGLLADQPKPHRTASKPIVLPLPPPAGIVWSALDPGPSLSPVEVLQWARSRK